MNDFNQYQDDSCDTAIYHGRGSFLGAVYCALKLNGEAGEVAEKIGKIMRDDASSMNAEKRLAIGIELGDVLWYIAMLAWELGFSLADIAEMNREKLAARASRGTLQGSGDSR